jgi:hypothetical protein
MEDKIRRLVRILVREALNNARVPSQLVSRDGDKEPEKDEEEVDEAMTTANVAGYTLPLGMGNDPAKTKRRSRWKLRREKLSLERSKSNELTLKTCRRFLNEALPKEKRKRKHAHRYGSSQA